MLPILSGEHQRLPEGTTLGEIEMEWLVRNGLGPLIHRVTPTGGFRSGSRTEARLRGADLTSRALTQDLLAEVADLLTRLRDAGIEATVLKGISYATRYYPEPHMRMMGDVDVLIAENDLPAAQRVLRTAGFVEPPSPWRTDHHAPPLHHPGKRLWVELHRALRPAESPEAAHPPLDPGGFEGERMSAVLGDIEVAMLTPECELALIAAGWIYDLKRRFGILGKPRPLFDATYLLIRSERHFDWDRIVAWSRGTYTGACIGVLLTYLERHDAYVGPAEIPSRILAGQPYVNRATLRVVHGLLDRYVIAPGLGRLATPNTVGSAFDALIAPRSPWGNLLAVPVNVAFPSRHPDRFGPGLLLRRLRRVVAGR